MQIKINNTTSESAKIKYFCFSFHHMLTFRFAWYKLQHPSTPKTNRQKKKFELKSNSRKFRLIFRKIIIIISILIVICAESISVFVFYAEVITIFRKLEARIESFY